jgi:Amt family ammonium transporter
VFATQLVNPLFKDGQGQALPMGLLEGNPGQLGNQVVGVLIAWGIAIVGSLILLKVTDLLVGLRVTQEEEVQGLDLSQHGEVGYDFES